MRLGVPHRRPQCDPHNQEHGQDTVKRQSGRDARTLSEHLVAHLRDAFLSLMAPELVQLCGARGFVTDFPVHRFAMRLEALRLEAGSADRLSSAVWADLHSVAGLPPKDPDHPEDPDHPSDLGPQRG